jgi:hypothetical protein
MSLARAVASARERGNLARHFATPVADLLASQGMANIRIRIASPLVRSIETLEARKYGANHPHEYARSARKFQELCLSWAGTL